MSSKHEGYVYDIKAAVDLVMEMLMYAAREPRSSAASLVTKIAMQEGTAYSVQLNKNVFNKAMYHADKAYDDLAMSNYMARECTREILVRRREYQRLAARRKGKELN